LKVEVYASPESSMNETPVDLDVNFLHIEEKTARSKFGLSEIPYVV